MKVLLKNNESTELEFCDLGLGYLAAGLRLRGHDVTLLLRAVTADEFRGILRDVKPDVVGIKVLSTAVPRTIETIEAIRSTIDTTVVIGGPHVTGTPQGRALAHIPADYGFRGEADRSFPEFVSRLGEPDFASRRTEVPGLIYRDNNTIVANPEDCIEFLDDLPFPAWELMPPDQYQSLVAKKSPAASVQITRGCTNRCSFCSEGGRRLRSRSIDNVMAEIRHLVEQFGVREIQFLDSNFLFSKRYIKTLCERILAWRTDLALCAPNGMRVSLVDEAVASLLAKAGFYRANIGIESGSREILRMVKKGITPQLVRETVPILRHHGIHVVGDFMLGFPGETKAQMLETRDLALSSDLTGANFAVYTPMPGTPLYETLVGEGKLAGDQNHRDSDFVTYENRLSELSPDQLRRFRTWCLIRFLFRFRTVKTLFELFADRTMRRTLIKRVYGMYIAKFLKSTKALRHRTG